MLDKEKANKQKYPEAEPKVIRVQEIPSAEYMAIKQRYKENVQRVEELEEKCRMLEDALKYGEPGYVCKLSGAYFQGNADISLQL